MAAAPGQTGGRSPEARARASDLRRLSPFEQPRSNTWMVPLPAGAVSTLLQGFRGSSQDDRYFVYADGPSDDKDEVVVHIHRSWTGFALAELTIKVPRRDDNSDGGGELDLDGDGARITRITYEASQARWDYELIGLANLDTAKGFAMHVCGDWVFRVRFPKPIWNDVEARFKKATQDFFAYVEALEEGGSKEGVEGGENR
ncbi:hypothetical protein SAMD00023353_1202090 [Rosellinia necatrix]|uniref:Uncharacterized protein n=1 Tax=Rosellinia necatrix TaxID=77044 RepID=A0A1S8A7P1_ROSNE|nr:hypothetical protein SAMD00023353_1202090 [Rosellinia necatrix]